MENDNAVASIAFAAFLSGLFGSCVGTNGAAYHANMVACREGASLDEIRESDLRETNNNLEATLYSVGQAASYTACQKLKDSK